MRENASHQTDAERDVVVYCVWLNAWLYTVIESYQKKGMLRGTGECSIRNDLGIIQDRPKLS